MSLGVRRMELPTLPPHLRRLVKSVFRSTGNYLFAPNVVQGLFLGKNQRADRLRVLALGPTHWAATWRLWNLDIVGGQGCPKKSESTMASASRSISLLVLMKLLT